MGFLDQMKQLSEIKQKMEEVKKRLDSIEMDVENDYARVTVNGNRKVTRIAIYKTDTPEILASKLQSAVNEALEKSENIMQSEMLGVTRGILPDAGA